MSASEFIEDYLIDRNEGCVVLKVFRSCFDFVSCEDVIFLLIVQITCYL
jgi:hypothetical protein